LPLALGALQEVVGADIPLRYFCQDESRWGLLTLNGRVITVAGVKPEGVYQWGRSTFWLYGLVEPLTGEHFFEQYDHLNGENFEHFIHQFAARYPDEVVVIQMDQASAHRAHEMDWPENIIPLFQPAYTPEVNPIERFWKHLKTPLQWETFKNLKSLRQRVQTVLAEMSEDVIRSVTGWEFITDAVLSVSSN
jgi:transposase